MALPVTAEGAVAAVQIGALAWAAWSDVVDRTIPGGACIVLAASGIALQMAAGPKAFALSAAAAFVLFVFLFALHILGALGGGDVKLLVAAALTQSPLGTVRLLAVTALAGGVLAMVHLVMRRLPRPALPPAGSWSVRRVYAAERWRILRRGPLPYGVAIACGGAWAILARGV